jgi:hypothetical protein
MRKNILIFIPTASLLMMMFSPRLTNAKTQELNTKARKTHPKPKKTSIPEAMHGSLPATQSNFAP